MLLRTVFIILLLAGCVPDENDVIELSGTVKFVSLEGGFYGIAGDDGKNYDPINLREDFKKDGLRVRFEARELRNRASFHMWGTLIELIKIEQL